MNKDLICTRFSKNLANYNENAAVQKQMAQKLISLLKKNKYNNILEIGCGTGFLTELAVKNLEFNSYIALDIVKECAEYIEEISDKITFVTADIEKYIQTLDKKFDLIISNAALQWVDDFSYVINNLKSKLQPEGELAISTFGKDNFKEIRKATNATLTYYPESELKSFFPDAEILSETHILNFKTPKHVLNHLKRTGVNAIEQRYWTKKDLLNFEKKYENICPEGLILTYNPIYIYIG